MTFRTLEDDITIMLPEDFDLEANLGYLTREKNECMYEIEDGFITKAIAIEKARFLIQISVIANKQMVVRFLDAAQPVEEWHREEIVKYIREWFDLDRDITPFYKIAEADPLLKTPVEKFRGLRVIGIPDLFEALCWGVLGQQINIAFAYTLKKQLVEAFGECMEWKGKKYWIFPSYKQISQLTTSDFSNIKMTLRKSEYVIGIAKLMASGEISKEELMKMSFQDAEKKLTQIRGVGPWTAHYVLMRCLRFGSAFPIDDVGLMNAIKVLRNMDRKPTKNEIMALSASWKNWESYATFYLWRTLY